MPTDAFGRCYFDNHVRPTDTGALTRTAHDKVSMASYQAPGGYDADGRPHNAPEPTAFPLPPERVKTVGTVHAYGSSSLVQNWLRICAYDYALGLRMNHNTADFQAKEDNFQESLGKLVDAVVAQTAVKYEAIIELRVAETFEQRVEKERQRAVVELRDTITRKVLALEADSERKVRDAKNEIRKQYIQFEEKLREDIHAQVREELHDALDTIVDNLV